MVMRNIEVGGAEKGKLAPKWEGPYIIKEEIRSGSYVLITENGKSIKNVWHTDNLNKYFQKIKSFSSLFLIFIVDTISSVMSLGFTKTCIIR